jgi:DNA-binding IclR family transcriptional regulator
VTPTYVSLLTDERCFTIAAAVRDRSGEVIGTLGVDVNVRSWTRI